MKNALKNAFVSLRIHFDLNEGSEVDKIIEVEILKELRSLLGEGNYVYLGDKYGIDYFDLFFLIKSELYNKSRKAVEKWKNDHNFVNCVTLHEQEQC